MPLILDSIEWAVDHVLAALPGDIVLGIPLGIGKPNPLVNALYRRIKADPSRRLKILTALSLEKPVGSSDLERHFMEPFVARVFGDYPDLDYVKDRRAGQLPENIEVMEFFFKTGDYLGNDAAQQSYISTNYTFAARDLALQGVNLLAQAVAAQGSGDTQQLSLSCNSDTTAELAERVRALPGRQVLVVAVINERLPFMPNAAVVAPDFFDVIVTDVQGTHALFAPPNMKVSAQEYAIGLHAASLVRDGGTLQIGIGALGDAIAHALILREKHNDVFQQLLGVLAPDATDRETEVFRAGLYGCSEMFVNGLLKLISAGIIRREVFPDETLQRLINEGQIGKAVDTQLLLALHAAGRISSPLRADDVDFLRRCGIFKAAVTYDAGALVWQCRRYATLLEDATNVEQLKELLGTELCGGIILHGGFFLGPQDFYEGLRTMPPAQLHKIEMHRIDFINQLGRNWGLATAQRQQARLMNTAMMVTMLGAAVSDGLESGQVVSGVGGQYNFVAMAHDLPGARSILMLRATRHSGGNVTSNLVWQYGHTTIPRHLRDIVITEYGVADLRAQNDSEVIKRLLAIADSRFQPELLQAAKQHGKLAADYQLPEAQRHNLPANLTATLAPFAAQLPDFPFGTDFTTDELTMLTALQKLKHATENPLEFIALAFRSLFEHKEVPAGYLERLGLDGAHSLKQTLLRRLFVGNL